MASSAIVTNKLPSKLEVDQKAAEKQRAAELGHKAVGKQKAAEDDHKAMEKHGTAEVDHKPVEKQKSMNLVLTSIILSPV